MVPHCTQTRWGRWLFSSCACLAFGSGCLFGDLDPAGRACDEAHSCPDRLICVSRPVSLQEVAGTCLPVDQAPTCVPSRRLCNLDQDWVEACEPDGHSTRLVEACLADTDCQPDIGACASACDHDKDCRTDETCDTGLHLCRPYPACNPIECSGICIGQACVPEPENQITTESGAIDLNCFTIPPSAPPDSPTECTLTGRVSLFPSVNPEETIGLEVQLSLADDPAIVLQTSPVEAVAGKGQYTFIDVATNREYVLVIPAGPSQSGAQVVTTIRAGFVLRADHCDEGLALSAMRKSTYDLFAAGILGESNANRGLLIGRVADCNLTRRSLAEVAVGLAIPPQPPASLYYFAEATYLDPDPDLTATSTKGYFAAGLPACRNEVGFLGKHGLTPLQLGSVAFGLQAGSVVLADLPLPGNLIP